MQAQRVLAALYALSFYLIVYINCTVVNPCCGLPRASPGASPRKGQRSPRKAHSE
jgi:hypothetical protein